MLDFSKTGLAYKNTDLAKIPEVERSPALGSTATKISGPAFRHVYQKLFGPTFPGEYFPPQEGAMNSYGKYVLSYPGLAFTFPLKHAAWSPSVDFVTMLSSSSTLPTTSMSVYDGSSWKESRHDLYTRPCPNPRSLALLKKGREEVPDEIDHVRICDDGCIEMLRHSSPPFLIRLGVTTPQDLVAELGPPDAIYRKNDRRLSIHKPSPRRSSQRRSSYAGSHGQIEDSTDTDQSSVHTATDDSDIDDGQGPADVAVDTSVECFYNYFHHGFDVFISSPAVSSPVLSRVEDTMSGTKPDHQVAAKVLLHANVPGSYPFNRYRRCRWSLEMNSVSDTVEQLSSETPFTVLSSLLREVLKATYSSEEEERKAQEGMVLNRGWGNSPGSSCELLDGWEEGAGAPKAAVRNPVVSSTSGLGNTQLFGYPGLLFEVLKNDAVSCLTVY